MPKMIPKNFFAAIALLGALVKIGHRPQALKWPFIEFWKLARSTNEKKISHTSGGFSVKLLLFSVHLTEKSPPNTIEQSFP